MEKHSILMNRKNQYYKNGHTAQSNLQIQCFSYQTSNGILHRTRNKLFKIHLELKMSPKSQGNPQQKEQSWSHHVTRLQTTLRGSLYRNKHIDQWSKIESRKMRPNTYNDLILTELTKTHIRGGRKQGKGQYGK